MRYIPLILASAIAAQVTAVHAAEAQAVFLEEVVVTAQKREQSLQDVPISVMAVSGDLLAERNINQVSELSKMAPGFTFAESTSDSGKGIAIRGVGSKSFSRGMDQSVGVVIDGVVASSTASSSLDMSDVERVEVLRGPQGMLFGKNASAGLLNIVTKKPTQALSYGLGATFSEQGEEKINAYLSGPILGDQVLGRVSYYSNERDGLLENTFPGGEDFNNRDEWGARAKLLVRPSDELELLFSADVIKRDHICCTQAPVISLSPALPSGAENDKILENDVSTGTTDYKGYSLEANYDLNDFTLTSITSWNKSKESSNVVSENLPVSLVLLNDSQAEYEQKTQEFRITSPLGETIDYVAGVYYFEKNLTRNLDRIYDGGFFGAPVDLSLLNFSDVEMKSLALFGQATYHLNETNRLSVGLRYNREKVDIDQVVDVRPGHIPEETIGQRQESLTDKAVSWRLIYEHNLTEDSMVYASVARGYKGPAASTLPSAIGADEIIIKPEIPTNMELGLKSTMWDNRLRLNAAIFKTEFDDFQASAVGTGVVPSFFLVNAGKLETQGIEIDFEAALTENLTVSGALAYIDASFKEFDGADCYPGQSAAAGCVEVSPGLEAQDLSGKDMPNSPDLTVTLSARYDLPLNDLPFDGYVQGSYYWQDEVQYSTSNNPLTEADAYGTFDLSIGLESDSGTYSVQLFAKNLFNEFHANYLSDGYAIVGMPLVQGLPFEYERRVGVSLRLDF